MTDTTNMKVTHLESQQNTPEVTENEAKDIFDAALRGGKTLNFSSDADYTIASAVGVQDWHYAVLTFTDTGSALTTGRNIITGGNLMICSFNNGTGNTLTVRPSAGASGVSISPGARKLCRANGSAAHVLDTTMVSNVFSGLDDVPTYTSAQGGYNVQIDAEGSSIEFVQRPYKLAFSFGGLPLADQELLRLPVMDAFTLASSLTGSRAVCAVSATATATFTLKKDGSQFATCVFVPTSLVGAYTASTITSFTASSILTVVAPASADASLEGIGFGLNGVLS